jgi:hypothetical protein
MLTFIFCVELISFKLLIIGVNQRNFAKNLATHMAAQGCGFPRLPGKWGKS